MAKKKGLWSAFFSLMLQVVPFVFNTLFAVFRFLLWAIVSVAGLLGKAAAARIRQQKLEAQRPRNPPRYEPLEAAKTVQGSVQGFEQWLLDSTSSIGLVIGSRGSGKSALGMRLLENVAARTNRPVCAMGFSPGTLPPWIRSIEHVEEVPNGAWVLIDEGGILFSSRSSMSSPNKVLSELLLIARHKDMSILFISQNSANLEINAIRQADYLLLRRPSLLQRDFERKKIQQVYDEAQPYFAQLSGDKTVTYIYSDQFRGIARNGLPGFWNERTGKAFGKYRAEH